MSELVASPIGYFPTLQSHTNAASRDAGDLQRRQIDALLQYPARTRLLQELRELLEPEGPVAWYGEGATPVAKDAAEAASRFLACLPNGFLDGLEISPEEDGGCILDWYRSNTHQLSIVFNGTDQLYYAAILGPIERASGRLPFYDSIPQEIFRLFQRLD
jgi:hypothetical protein